MSKLSYTENYNLTQYSEVNDPVFLNDITRDNAIIDSALQVNKETAENAVSVANEASSTANDAKSIAEGVASDLQVTNQNVSDLDVRVTQNESDIALLQPAKITALENKVDSNTNLINALQNRVVNDEETIAEHGDRLDALESASAQLRTDVDTLRSDFDTCCADVQAHLSTIDTEQGVQNDRLTAVENRVTVTEQDIENLKTEDETITGQIELLTGQVTPLVTDVDNLKDLVGDDVPLETVAQTLTGAINEIAEKTGMPIDDDFDINSEHAVQNKVITAKVGTDTLTTTAQDLSGAVNELDSDVGALETTVGDSNSGLVKGLADTNSDIDAIEQSLGGVIVTVGDSNSGLVKGVSDLQTTVGDNSSGLVKDVSDLSTTVGDSSSGLVKDVDDLETAVGDSNSGLVKDVSDLQTAVGDSSSGLVKDVNDLLTMIVPTGAILPYGGSSSPSNFLLCDGSAVSRDTYSDLFSVIGTAFGSGDGSTTFNVPDLRECTTKGAGLYGGTVGAHVSTNGLTVGEFIDDRVQEHIHQSSTPFYHGAGTSYPYNPPVAQGSFQTNPTHENSGRKGATTEVKAIGVNYIIKT